MMRKTLVICLVSGLAAATAVRAHAQNTKEVQALIDDYSKEQEKWHKKFKKPVAADYATHPLKDFIPKFKALAEANPKSSEALAAMLWTIQNTKFIRYTNWDNKPQYFEWAIKGVKEGFASDPRMAQVLPTLIEDPFYYGPAPFFTLYEAVIKDNPEKEARAWATYALGYTYKQDFGPVDTRPYKEKTDGRKKSEDYYRKVMTDFADTAAAKEAAKQLKAYGELKEGAKAPALEGVDIDGKPIKLADYAGKVVVVDFWTLECDDCKQLNDLAREISESLKDKPFMWLGINVDPKAPDELKKEFAAVGASGTNITDRGRKLADSWGVDSLPAVFIIDHQGVIRHRMVKQARVKALVEALIKRAEAGLPAPPASPPNKLPSSDKPSPPTTQPETPKPEPPKPGGEATPPVKPGGESSPPAKSDPTKGGGP